MKEALILFSGGKDSFLSTLLMIEKGYKVHLVTYENGCGLKASNALHGAKRILKKYGEDRVNIIGIKRTEAIWREFIRNYYNMKASDILKLYGEATISQFNCLTCRLSMYVMTIILCLKNNIDTVVDGARKSQLFALEQDELLERFEKLFKKYNIKIEYPVKELEDDYELKNQLLIRGFVPKTLEPQCLLGVSLKKEEIDEKVINAMEKIYDNLLKDKAEELIQKYKNVNLSGEYL